MYIGKEIRQEPGKAVLRRFAVVIYLCEKAVFFR